MILFFLFCFTSILHHTHVSFVFGARTKNRNMFLVARRRHCARVFRNQLSRTVTASCSKSQPPSQQWQSHHNHHYSQPSSQNSNISSTVCGIAAAALALLFLARDVSPLELERSRRLAVCDTHDGAHHHASSLASASASQRPLSRTFIADAAAVVAPT
jgi:hypothetical protein